MSNWNYLQRKENLSCLLITEAEMKHNLVILVTKNTDAKFVVKNELSRKKDY